MHRLTKLLVVALMLACVIGVASAATYQVENMPGFGPFESLIGYAPDVAGSPVTFVVEIETTGNMQVDKGLIFGNVTGNYTVTAAVSSASVTFDNTIYDPRYPYYVNITGPMTLNAGQKLTLTVAYVPADTTYTFIELNGSILTASQVSVTPVSTTAGKLLMTIGPDAANMKEGYTPQPILLSSYDGLNSNSGPDDGASLLERSTSVPTSRPTLVETPVPTMATPVPTAAESTPAPTSVPATDASTSAPASPTATAAPLPFAGILAGLGAAALVLRRK
jgi:hypothetical protein